MTTERFENILEEYLGEDYNTADITVREVVKNNIPMTGVCVRLDGSSVGPTFYPETYEDDETVIGAIRNGLTNAPEIDAETFLKDFENLKIGLKVRNANGPKEDVIYKVVAKDLMVIPVVVLDDISSDLGTATVKVTPSLVNMWGVTEEEVFARANTESVFADMFTILSGMIAPEELEIFVPSESGMYVLTNPSRINGAALVTLPEVQKMIAEKLGENYYVLPSSIHECIVLPASKVEDVNPLLAMVYDINRNQVAQEERLTDSVYYYDGELKRVATADESSAA